MPRKSTAEANGHGAARSAPSVIEAFRAAKRAETSDALEFSDVIRALEQADAQRLAREDTYRLRQRIVAGEARAAYWQRAAIGGTAGGLGAGFIAGLWLAGAPVVAVVVAGAIAGPVAFICGRLWQATDAALRPLEPESRREGR
jgi:hypothetical protein